MKSLYRTFQHLPEGGHYADIRATIELKEAALKGGIIQSRSVGSLIDTCRGAPQRALKRKETQAAALETARDALTEAEKDVINRQAELAALEVSVAASVANRSTFTTSSASRYPTFRRRARSRQTQVDGNNAGFEMDVMSAHALTEVSKLAERASKFPKRRLVPNRGSNLAPGLLWD